MNSSYDDIRSRIAEIPEWWDQNGVPRYGPFRPDGVPNIYADEAILFVISCQHCGTVFNVCLSGRSPNGRDMIAFKSLRYGDPPIGCGPEHKDDGCVGNTMNSVPRRVLEYWHRPFRVNGKLNSLWFRDPSLEVDIEPDWAKR